MLLAYALLFIAAALCSFSHAAVLDGKLGVHVPLLGRVDKVSFNYLTTNAPESRLTAPVTVFALSQSSGLLANLNPRNGSIVWRQFVPDLTSYKQWSDVVLASSSSAGLHLFNARNGVLLWDFRLLQPTSIVPVEAGSALLAANATHIVKLHASTGNVQWQRTLEDLPGYTLVGLTEDGAVVSHNNELAMLHLEVATGQSPSSPIQLKLPKTRTHQLLFPSSPSRLVVLSDNTVHSICLGSHDSSHVHRSATYHSIESLGLEETGYFLARRRQGPATLLRFIGDCKVEVAWEFPDSVRILYLLSIDQTE